MRSSGTTRLRAAAATACSAVTLLVFGHDAIELLAHDHAAHGALAACVLLFTVLVAVGLTPPSPVRVGAAPPRGGLAPRSLVAWPVDGRARASPAALQRFLA